MGDENIQRNLRRIEGQIKGLQRMIAEKRECDDILTQIMAAKAALDRVTRDLAEAHLDSCLTSTAPEHLKEKLLRTIRTLSKM
ncbi:MAG TPA: metal-sensitive transcriptional regulator [Stenomitos sp.]